MDADKVTKESLSNHRLKTVAIGVSICLVVLAAISVIVALRTPRRPEPWRIAQLQSRVAPDLSHVPNVLPQGGQWRGVEAFPNLTFHQPIRIVRNPASGGVFVFEKSGLIRHIHEIEGVHKSRIFLDLRDRLLPDHRGPIDLAFHPKFSGEQSPSHNYVFVFYKRNDGYDVLSRFAVTPEGISDVQSEVLLIEQLSSKTHAGGAVTFGTDGFLYVSSGEERANDQKIDRSLLGGVFRIDVDMIGGDVSHAPLRQPIDGRTANYFIPNDNPFVGRAGALEEFWALGLRNPFTMTLDPHTERIWIGDVGRNRWEEVNCLIKGANYEWSYREGPMKGDRMEKPSAADYVGAATPPFYSYQQSEGNNSIIGGFVYRGQMHPELYGKYIFGDNGSSRIWSMSTNDEGSPKVETLCQLPLYRFEGVCGFGPDTNGEILVCVLGNERFDRPGQVLRLVANKSWPQPDFRSTDQKNFNNNPIRNVSHVKAVSSKKSPFSDRLSQTGLFADLQSMTPAEGVIPYVINTPLWSDAAIKTRWIAVPGDGTSDSPSSDRIIVDSDFPHDLSFPDGTVFIKHFELPVDENHVEKTRRLETRVTVLKQEGDFCGMTYRWNDQQTEAYLIQDRGTVDVSILTRSGSTRKQKWTFPNSADCRMCHNSATGFVLGVNIPGT